MSEALVKHTPQSIALAEMERMAEAVAKSNLFGIKSKDQALALMLIAQAEGRHPALAARDYNIIQGKPSKTSEAMLRDFIDCGGKVEWHNLSDTIADATFSHAQGGSVRITWDMERASKAGLSGKDNWKKHPRQMLRSRTVSEGVRTVCPSATSGFYETGEVADFSEAKNVNPKIESMRVISFPSQEQVKTFIEESAKETNIEYEPEYERKVSVVTQGDTEFHLMCDVEKQTEKEDDTADMLFTELDSMKSIAKQLIERIHKLEPSRDLDQTTAFLTGNEKATYAAIDKIKSAEKQAKLETLIGTAQLWLKSHDIAHGGTGK